MTTLKYQSLTLYTATQEICNNIPIDCVPIQKKSKHVFKYLSQHNIQSSLKTIIRTLDEHILNKPPHIRHLICNYSLNTTSDSLLELLNNKTLIYLSTDGAREDTKSGGGWLIATDTGQRFIHGFNPDYGQSEDIHSYRSEMYASLASLLFIHTYAEFYNIPITNNITGLCENEAYVNKLNEIIANTKYLKYLYKTTEHEAFKLISTIIPINYKLHHIKSHQDDECSYDKLPLPTKFNVQADKIATHNVRKPINTHLLTSLFAIYIKKQIHFSQYRQQDTRVISLQHCETLFDAEI